MPIQLFPLSGDASLTAGILRNFEVYDPLDFLAEITQLPNRGKHQIRYYGWYSNKKRGMREKKKPLRLPDKLKRIRRLGRNAG
jgi:hypothetical protein